MPSEEFRKAYEQATPEKRKEMAAKLDQQYNRPDPIKEGDKFFPWTK